MMATEHLSTSSLGHVATSEGPGSVNGKVPEEKARFGGVRRTILFIACDALLTSPSVTVESWN